MTTAVAAAAAAAACATDSQTALGVHTTASFPTAGPVGVQQSRRRKTAWGSRGTRGFGPFFNACRGTYRVARKALSFLMVRSRL
eukprot:7712469-Pyramimonas_sp.AAC.1